MVLSTKLQAMSNEILPDIYYDQLSITWHALTSLQSRLHQVNTTWQCKFTRIIYICTTDTQATIMEHTRPIWNYTSGLHCRYHNNNVRCAEWNHCTLSVDRPMGIALPQVETRLLNLYLVKLGYQVPTRQPQTMLLDQLTASNSRNHVVYSLLPKW